ncbi:histidine protein methyltransferase 1 homolog [Stegostoma tigrinum]|uniref:histidine protein methyltransferase 1 homolog n=1 Tax=Stegostoma tigrinum TaxID=3053191 RepID=UPI00286FB49A|nr:histidine protein methyltransferase 1 homolog [Stegostoma tigrinum]
MEFKFEFNLEPPEQCGTGEAEPVQADPERRSESVKEHRVLWEELERILEDGIVEEVEVGGCDPLCLRHLNVWAVERALSLQDGAEAGVSGAIARRSDLVSGVYEGGLKIWQCTFDLIEHLSGVDLEGRRVLDLGCGAGLLGIVALRRRASEVHFQDYNSSVIDEVTLPNVALNEDDDDEEEEEEDPPVKRRKAQASPSPRPLSRCRFFSGDWSRFGDVHGGSIKYDVILSSETLYNPDSYGDLHDTLSSLLAQDGVVYLATKSHYFGVGGGIHLFESFVKQKEVFYFQTVKVIDDGLQRCIATMSFNKAQCS